MVVIPTEGKRPHQKVGRKTRNFWTVPPTRDQLDSWFMDSDVTSYAVLCGAVSGNLFVLDFDEKKAYRKFKKQFKTLAQTLTVRTTRGYHVYLRADELVRPQKFYGGDLQGEGTYVIGTGSEIGNRTYTIQIDLPIYELNNEELYTLLSTITSKKTKSTTGLANPNRNKQNHQTQIEKIISIYQDQAPSQGRNNALYKAAHYANIMRVPIGQLQVPLAQTYAQTPPYWSHKSESYSTRYTEGMRTIESAYNGTSVLKLESQQNRGKIPTALREAMIQSTAQQNADGILVNGSTVPGRLLEALINEGIEEHQIFTIKQAQEIGKRYKIGDKSTYNVLTREQYKQMFPIVKYPPYAGNNDNATINNNVKAKKGRKTSIFFRMPSIEELCILYEVIPQSWDNLDPSDLMSAKAYRLALHREYVRRVIPEQSVTYLSNRLGCHPRSLYRYDKSLGIKVTPIHGFVPLTWDNVDNPSFYKKPRQNGVTPGKWLQRADGKRFPAKKGIALQQLKKANTLIACERHPSRRFLPSHPIPVYEIIWRRSDLPVGKWDVGGKPYVMPKFGPESEKIKVVSDLPDKGKRSQNTVVKQSSLTNSVIDHSLTLIAGIGVSRQNKLLDVGISTLSQLANASPQKLASLHWYGGYVTIHTIVKWQEEAEILLGLRERNPKDVEAQALQETQQMYRKRLSSLLKFVTKTFDLVDSISPIRDIPNIEPTKAHLTLLRMKSVSRNKKSHSVLEMRLKKINEIAERYFTFYHEYIEHMLSLQDWQLEEYGFENRKFWIQQSNKLTRYKDKFQSQG